MSKNQKRKAHNDRTVRKFRDIHDDTMEFIDLDEDAYYGTEEDARYYEDYENDRYYADDDDGRYFEDEEDDRYYADEDDGRYYEDEEDDLYYADDDEYDIYYEEDDLYYEMDDDEDAYYAADADEEDGFFARIGDFFAGLSAVDCIVAALGIFILAAAVVTGTVYFSARSVSEQVDAFAEVGTEIENISVIGESGLIAVADAESARISQMIGMETETEVVPGTQAGAKPQDGQIEVGINLTTIQSDIKIKFVNKETNKLIGSVPFEVEVTGGSKTLQLKDDDKDGIIHQSGLAAGTYTVKLKALPDGEYEKYNLPAQGETIKVTDKIAYKKVEVADEIKTEAEVNVAAEDTAKQNTVVESTLKDTVEWVESSKTEENADSNYEEIKRENIPDPVTLARAGTFMKLVNDTATGALPNSPEQPSVPVTGEGTTNTPPTEGTPDTPSTGEGTTNTPPTGGTPDMPSTGEGTTNTPPTSEGTTNTPPAGGTTDTPPTSEGTTNTPPAGGTTDTPPTGTGTTNTPPSGPVISPEQPSVPTGPQTPSAPTDAEKLSALNPALNTKTLALAKGESAALSVVVTGNEPYTVEWSSSSPIAGVNNGTVTGVEAGSAVVAAVIRVGSATTVLNCTVTVTETAVSYTEVRIEGSNTVQMGLTSSLKGTTVPEGGVVTWASDNTGIVTVDSNGVMTGVSEGTAVITGACGNVKSTLQVTVTKNRAGDTVTKLKDKDGNQVYIKNDEGRYVEAVYADYYNDKMLYLRKADADCFYTGWQTIDGHTYFYDKNGKYVTGEQIIQGAKYTFDSEGRMSNNSGTMGIDVSKWNGSIDWNAVKNSGVSYVIIRCGYRGSSTGALIEDPKFASNIKGAKAAGLKVGVYFFSQAVNEAEAVEEASMALNLVSGYGLEYPIFLDVEASGGRGDAIDTATRTAVCRAFCATVQNSGYKAGVYANTTWFNTKINAGSLTDYKIWLAQYASAPTYTATRYDMWQYTSKGKIGGVSGSVDMNISYLNY